MVMDGQGQMRVSELDALSARCFDIVLCARLSTSNCYLPQCPHLWNRDDLRPYLLRIAGDVRERISKKHLGGSQPTAMAQGRGCCFLTQKAPAPCSAGPFLFCEWLSWWKIISVCVQGGSAPGQAGGGMARAGGHGGWSGPPCSPRPPPQIPHPRYRASVSRPGRTRESFPPLLPVPHTFPGLLYGSRHSRRVTHACCNKLNSKRVNSK